jgi:Flp pilus assembly protein TadG
VPRVLSVGLDGGKPLIQRTHGYAVAEFAVVIPAILFVVAIVISLFGITTTQLQLESAAVMGARILGRGDPLPDSYRNSLPIGTHVTAIPEGEVVEVVLTTTRNIGLPSIFYSFTLTAKARARLEPVFDEFG